MEEITQEIPSIEFLEKLIYNDEYFQLLANSKIDKITKFSQKTIVKYLKEYIRNLINRNCQLSKVFWERASYYNDKFSLDIPYFRITQDGLDEEFCRIIMKNVKGTKKDVARKIYLNLGKYLNYDPRMTAYHQNLNIECIDDLFYTKTSSIKIDKNIVTCKSWAEVYVAFLSKNQIDAKVVKDEKTFHYYVLIDFNGHKYKADATNSYLDQEKIFINDLTRIKLNTPTCGYFAPYNIQIDNEYNFKTLMEQYETYLKKYPVSTFVTTGNATLDTILAKLDYLNTIIYNLPQIEAVAYLKQVCSHESEVFDRSELTFLKSYLINILNENQQCMSTILIIVKNDNNYIYRILKIPEGLIDVKQTYLEQIIDYKYNEKIPELKIY